MHAVQLRTPLPRPYQNHGKFLINGGILCQVFCESCGAAPVTGVVVPTSPHDTVLKHLHNQSGHFGEKKTLEEVKERFFWPV